MTKGHTPVYEVTRINIPLTSEWVQIGNNYSGFGYSVLAVYLKLKINDSQDFRIRILGKIEQNDNDDYLLPINLMTAEKIYVYESFAEIDVDEDKNIILFFDIDTVVPFFKIEVQGGFIGANPAVIESMSYCLGER